MLKPDRLSKMRRGSIRGRVVMMSIAVLAAQCASQSSLADTEQYQGRAIDPSSGRLLYRETHLVERDNNRIVTRVVLYQCADGNTFARKRVDYASSLTAPDFELFDSRDGYREGVRRQHGHIFAFVKAGVQAAESVGVVASEGTLVADAGFDEFVARNWSALVAGRTLALDFVIPSKGRTYGFNVSRQAQIVVGGVPAIVFRLRLGGLLALFAPDIDVTYGLASRNLLRFEGVTNIRSTDGRQMVARIDFLDAAPSRIAASVLQSALAMPLTSCVIAP
jgi:hypothetical protein